MPRQQAKYSGVYPSGRSGWQYRVLLPPGPDGRRRQEVRGGFATPEAASEARLVRLRQLGQGISANPRDMTVGAWLTQYIDGRVTIKPATAHTYRRYAALYIVPHLGAVRLEHLTPARVRGWLATLARTTTLTPRTIRTARALLSAACIQAVQDGMLPRNPVALAAPPPAARHVPTVWSDAEIARFLTATTDDDLAALWRLALLVQLRPGELLALRWDDLDLARGTISIRTTRTLDGEGHVTTGPAKTPASIATLPLPDSCVEALRRHRRQQAAHILALPPGRWQEHGLVFPARGGTMLANPTINRRLRLLCQTHGLPVLTAHELRHSGATMLARARENPKLIANRLRHTSAAFTLDTYVALADAEQSDVSARIDAALRARDAQG